MQLQKEQWNAFVKKTASDGGLLQSFEWGEFQRARGRQVWRESVIVNDDIVSVAQMIEHPAPLGWSYGYVPRGPLLYRGLGAQEIVEKLVNTASAAGMMFVRIEPESDCQLPVTDYLLLRSRSLQPTKTLRIDLSESEGEILAAMHQKTRYNINIAKRHGVRVETGTLDVFYQLLKETGARDGFHLHDQAHYDAMLATLDAEIVVASLEDDPLAAALVVYFGDHAYYMHGASTQKKKNVMAPYALHWSIMQRAKQRGMRIYDLWGIDEAQWPGVTRFKKGFAPKTSLTTYPGAQDIVLSPVKRNIFRLGRTLIR